MRRTHRRALIVAIGLALAGAIGREAGVVDGPFVEQAKAEKSAGGASSPAGSSPAVSSPAVSSPERVDVGAFRNARLQRSSKSTQRVRPGQPSNARSRVARSPSAAPSSLLLLDVFERPDDPLVAVAGLDRKAPRDLVLWQVDELRRRAAPVVRVRSAADGVFEVERLLLSSRGVRLVATEAGGDPFGPGASHPIDFAPRSLEPSPAWLEGPEGNALELVIAPDGRPQVLVLGDDEGRELARVELPARSSLMAAGATTRRPLDLAELPSQIARETPDGRRSSWHPLPRKAETSQEEVR